MNSLADIAEVRAGHTFRQKVKPAAFGGVSVVQMRDLAGDHVDWSTVTVAELKARKEPDWLQAGDILLPSVGGRSNSVLVSHVPERSICTNHLFSIRPNRDRALPEYLAWLLNQPTTQRQLAAGATGGNVKLLRRTTLESVQIYLPPIEDQRLVADLVATQREERRLLEALILNREKQISAIAQKIAISELKIGDRS